MERISYLLYVTGWRVVRMIPERMAYGLFNLVAKILAFRRGRTYLRLRSNLALVADLDVQDPRADALAARGLRSYLRYWCDAFRLPDWTEEEILRRTRVIGEEILIEATANGRGAVVALPHSGNWDLAGAWANARGWHVVSVAEVLRPQRLFERFLHYRRAIGLEIHPLGSPRVVALLAQRLREGAVVALVSDRDLSRAGVPVTFFGRPAAMPKGPASLALTTGASLVPAHVGYEQGGIVITFYPPVETAIKDREGAIADLTQKFADAFARGIAEKPEDWHMVQRVWVDR